jgi:UDP-glucuronate 4-epimerase
MRTVLVTGVAGFIGSWVARTLIQRGLEVVGIDISEERHRLRMLGLDLPVHRVDVRDWEGLRRLVSERPPQAVIHLAALQIPGCRADPRTCVEVNVGGTMNLLELAREHGFPVVYASSAAVYGPDLGRPLGEEEGVRPQTLYGVFKRTNEECARVYGQDYGVRSVGLRPYVVYGPGRDQGLTSDVTQALRAAVRGEPFRIRFGGRIALQYAADVAEAFVRCALAPPQGARVYNLRGVVASVAEVVGTIEEVTGRRGLVTWEEDPIPIAADLSDMAFQQDYGPFPYRGLHDGLRETVEIWRAAGMLGA